MSINCCAEIHKADPIQWDVTPLSILSLMINRECGMQCPHCDLPTLYHVPDQTQSACQWKDLLCKILPIISPKVVSIAAREPLYDASSRDITKQVLRSATAHNIRCGFVTNGVYLNDFFLTLDSDFHFDFLDISWEYSFTNQSIQIRNATWENI